VSLGGLAARPRSHIQFQGQGSRGAAHQLQADQGGRRDQRPAGPSRAHLFDVIGQIALLVAQQAWLSVVSSQSVAKAPGKGRSGNMPTPIRPDLLDDVAVVVLAARPPPISSSRPICRGCRRHWPGPGRRRGCG